MPEIINIECPFCETGVTARLTGYGDYTVYACENCGEYLDEADTTPLRGKISRKLKPRD